MFEGQATQVTSEAPAFSDYFSNDGFLAEKAVHRLLAGSEFQYGERRLLLMGLLCWIIAPDDPLFLQWKTLIVSDRRIRGATQRMAKDADIPHDDPRVEAVLRFSPEIKWLRRAFEALGGNRAFPGMPSVSDVLAATRQNARSAAYAGDIVGAVRLHLEHISKENAKYGNASLAKAQAVVAALIECRSTSVVGSQIQSTSKAPKKPETLRSEVWLPRRKTVAWCYAASMLTIKGKPLLAKFATTGNVPKTLLEEPEKLAHLIGMARFVQEAILTQLPKEPRIALMPFNFPPIVKPAPFTARTYTADDLIVVREKSIDRRWSGGKP